MALRKIPEAFTEAAVDDEIVVMTLDRGEFFALTGTAAETWQLIDGTRDLSTIIAELSRQYDEGAHAVAVDTEAFIATLVKAGLVRDD